VWITNQIGAPYGSPFVAITNSKTYTTNKVSGDFFLIPTNWCGFDLRLAFPLNNPPQTYSQTNTVVYNGYSTNGSVGTNATVGGNAYGLTQFFLYQYTNYNYAVYPGICQPVLAFGTNYTTNTPVKYEYSFINVVTNHYFTNAFVSVFQTNISAVPGNPIDVLSTNVVVTNFYTNLTSGDFYIVPPTWCGYQIVALLTNLIAPTNIVLTNQNLASNGVSFTYIRYLTYTNYTYSIRPGFCEPALAFETNKSTNITATYSYYFGSIVTNHYFTNGLLTVVTTNKAIWTNGLVGIITNFITTNTYNNQVGGDFFIVPQQFCDFTILSTQLTTAVASTNRLIQATNLPGVQDLGQQYSVTAYTSYTNSTYLVRPSTCTTDTPQPALRQGIGRVTFIRANYDSLVGRFFQPLTNDYQMVKITNGLPVKEFYRRVVTAPDILFRAQDMASGPAALPVIGGSSRSLSFDATAALGNLAGPGTIPNATTFTFNKVGNIWLNGSLNNFGLSTNAFLDQTTVFSTGFIWGSYDISTNDPVIYPNGTGIANLANQMFIQVSPSTVPDGTNGVAYPAVVFTGSGGQSPYTWAAPNLTGLVPGMTFNPATATLSGTPAAAGTFNFTLQLTDAVNRVINLNYQITIH
jgi:hypothetical protein